MLVRRGDVIRLQRMVFKVKGQGSCKVADSAGPGEGRFEESLPRWE